MTRLKDLFPDDFIFAENGLDSFSIFNGRKEYREKAYPQRGPKAIDFWYEKPFYGKVDGKGDAIFLSETNLKMLSSESSLFAADFVVDAYEDLVEYFEEARIGRKIELKDSQFTTLEPTKSWESANDLHHQYISDLYDAFVTGFLLINRRHEKVQSFKDFMNMFMKFIKESNGKVPVTRSGFIYSRFCPVTISGIVIEFKDLDHSEDETKRRRFIEDPNFNFYRYAARKFGFMVDKNAPWRLVADVSSQRMQKYMNEYGVQEKPGTSSDLFEIYYYNALDVDIDILSKYMLHMYNSFVSAYPTVKNIELTVGDNTQFSTGQRQLIDEGTFNRQFGDLFWLKVYFELRVIESKKKINPKVLNLRIKKALELYNTIDIAAALRYINSEVRISLRNKNV